MSPPGNPFDPDGEFGSDWSTSPALDSPPAAQEDVTTAPALVPVFLPRPHWHVAMWLSEKAVELVADFNQQTGLSLTTDQAWDLLACAGVSNLWHFQTIIDFVKQAKAGDIDWEAQDPCTVLWLARLGICYWRVVQENELPADVYTFWLDGKARDAANLRHETVVLHPDDPAAGASVLYYPLPATDFIRELDPPQWDSFRSVIREHYRLALNGVCERLGAPPDVEFPPVTTWLMHDQAPLYPAPNRLLTQGRDWLFWEHTMKLNRNSHPRIWVGFGDLTVVSRAEVVAQPSQRTDPATDETTDGWEVEVLQWQVRAWDFIDFHLGASASVEIGGSEVFFDDDLSFQLREGGACPDAHGTDFLVMTDAWVNLDLRSYGQAPKVFLAKGAPCGHGDAATSATPLE